MIEMDQRGNSPHQHQRVKNKEGTKRIRSRFSILNMRLTSFDDQLNKAAEDLPLEY
jgi:hypothetical protein